MRDTVAVVDISNVVSNNTVATYNVVKYADGSGSNPPLLHFSGSNNIRTWIDGQKVYIGEDSVTTETWIRGASISSTHTIQVSSDRRLKKDIQKLEDTYSKIVDTTVPVRYRYKTDDDNAPYHFGYIANDVKSAIDNAGIDNAWIVGKYTDDDDGVEYLTLAYEEMIPLLHAKILSMQAQIDSLYKEVKGGKSNE